MKKSIALLLIFIILSAFLPSAVYADGDYNGEHFDVPQIRVTTKDGVGNTLEKSDGYVDASIEITDMDGSKIQSPISFKVRGNSTSMTMKKPFTFKFPNKTDVFGFGKAKRWVLLANAYDVTFIRNYFTFDWAKRMGIEYTSEQRIVELWVDGKFKGCYTLTEPVCEGKTRVDINIEENRDFLVEIERARVDEGVVYFISKGFRFSVQEPDPPSEQEVCYIQSTMERIIGIMSDGDREAIEQAVDVESFVKLYVLNEYVKDADFDLSSVFFYYKDGKLYAGPPWDYDLTMGNTRASVADSYSPENIFAQNKNIIKFLCKYDWFLEQAREVYKEYYAFLEDSYSDGGYFDSFYAQYEPVISRNFNEAGWVIWHKLITVHDRPFPTYAENLDYLKNWCKTRNEWLYNYFDLEKDLVGIKGDADGNGTIDINDATIIQRVIAKLCDDFDEYVSKRGDIRGEGLDINDATDIQRFVAGYSDKLGLGSKVFR